MERRMSFWQQGNILVIPWFKMKTHTCCTYSHTSKYVCRYRKVPSDRCEGGFTPQLIDQTVIRPCGVKTSPAPPAKSSSPVTHFDTPVSRFVICVHLYSFMWYNSRCMYFSQRERLVLILVCAVAAVVVLIAVISAIFAVRRVVYPNRWDRHTFVQHVLLHPDNINSPLLVYCCPLQDTSVPFLQPPDSGWKWHHSWSRKRHQQQRHGLPAGLWWRKDFCIDMSLNLSDGAIFFYMHTYTFLSSSFDRILLNDTWHILIRWM